jgi:hypothetical protein
MATDPFDSSSLGLTPEQIAELASLQKKQSSKQPRTTPTEFVMFPYEQILRAGGRLRNVQLVVLAELAHLRFKLHENPVPLGNQALEAVGIGRWAKYDALAGLEDVGLISVELRCGGSPLVTLLWD